MVTMVTAIVLVTKIAAVPGIIGAVPGITLVTGNGADTRITPATGIAAVTATTAGQPPPTCHAP